MSESPQSGSVAVGGGGSRGQLSLPAVEAAVGVTLLLAVAVVFTVPLPQPATSEVQLDTYASDTATVLGAESARHAGRSRLAEVARSAAAFERERAALRRRVGAILGDNLLFQVETPHGSVGYPVPPDSPAGRATVQTQYGPVVVMVWYV